MLPNRCSIRKDGKPCSNPPEFIVTVICARHPQYANDDSGGGFDVVYDGTFDTDEYMIGVTCGRHRQVVLAEVRRLQDQGKITRGTVGFTPVKPVGTDCIRGDPDDLVQIDTRHD